MSEREEQRDRRVDHDRHPRGPGEETGMLLSALIDSLPDAVLAISLDGTIRSWNKAAEAFYGYSRDEAVGHSIAMLLRPGDSDSLFKAIERIRVGEDFLPFRACRLRRDGSEAEVEVQLCPVVVGGRIVGVSSIERRQPPRPEQDTASARTQHRFELISNSVPQIIWENDRLGKATYFNRRWFEYSGKTQEATEGPGWIVISHVNDHHAISAWKASLQTETVFESEARLRRADGEYRWHLLRNVPLKDEHGTLLGWYGTATDIDRLRKVELSLQEMSEKLSAVFEAAVDFAIIPLDTNGYITDWNSGAEKMFGYSRPEAVGQFTDVIFTHEDRHGRIPEIEMQRAAATGRSKDERWHLRKDGSRFFMSGVLTPIYSGETIAGYVKIARDITDRKLTEEALFMSEQRKSVLLQSAQIGEWEWDIAGNTIELSDHASALLCLPPGTGLEDARKIYRFIHEDDRAHLRQQMTTALAGLNVFQAEFRMAAADTQDLKWVNAYGRVIAHRDDQPVRMIGVVYDVSERKLQEKFKDDFISTASHELRTPVTSIRMYSEILEELLRERDDPAHAELVGKLNEQVDRLIGLIHSLLDSTNVAEGHLKLFPQEFDLNQLIADLVQELRLTLPSHKLVWRPSNVSLVHADHDRIRQVVVNLISNAVKYSPSQTEVIISTDDDQDGVVVRVRDYGTGVSVYDQPRIFQRYYRVRNKIVANTPGLGLGLYISAEIIRQHMGTIGVESAAGEGATFYFKLPYS